MSKNDVPKTLGAKIDKLYALREERLALERQAEKLKDDEALYQGEVLKHLASSRVESARGKLATATRRVTVVGKVGDWTKLYAHIVETGSFELLQRRLNDGSFRERVEAGHVVPGVEAERVVKLSLAKAGS